MDYQYNPSFLRDVKKTAIEVQFDLRIVLESIKRAQAINDLPQLKKLKGAKNAYRIRVGNYRLCFFLDDKKLTLSRFLPRKDVYRFFP